MEIRIEGDTDALLTFITEHDYPYSWSGDSLRRYALCVRVQTDQGQLAGYIWANWDHLLEYTLAFHACIHPEFRGRWLNADLFHDLKTLGRFLGAKALYTYTPDSRDGKLVSRMLKRLGFTEAEPGKSFIRIDK